MTVRCPICARPQYRRRSGAKASVAEVRRVLELRRELAHATASKVEALRAWRMDDGRVRGALVYHGAATGRWVGRGPQPQNFRRDAEGGAEKVAAMLAGGEDLAIADRSGWRHRPRDDLRGARPSADDRRFQRHRSPASWRGSPASAASSPCGQKFDRTLDPADDPYVVIGREIGHAESDARAAGKIADLAFGYQGGVGA